MSPAPTPAGVGVDTERRERPPAATERLLDLSRALTAELELPRVLSLVLDGVLEWTGAERGFLVLFESDGPRVAAARNMDREEIHKAQLKVSRTVLETARAERRPVVSRDAQEDGRFDQSTSVQGMGLRSVLALPLRYRDEVPGVLYLDHRFHPGRFERTDLDLLARFGDQAAIAIVNARLLDENRRQREALAGAREESTRLKGELETHARRPAEEPDRAREAALSDPPRNRPIGGLVGESVAMRHLYGALRRAARVSFPVLIQGESGTGKELVARILHDHGPRKHGPYIALNCGALPEGLLETELFGSIKGAFTGADRSREGHFVRADGGTLFLDEIGTMGDRMQEALLRVLQDGDVRPVGGSVVRKVDVRIVSAGNARLERLVEEGRFRKDLYYRLNAILVVIPPLRDRREDIPRLAEHFLAEARRRAGGPVRTLSREASARLMSHDWPGNVRELKNVVITAATLNEGPVIGPAGISARIAPPAGAAGGGPAGPGPDGPIEDLESYARRIVEGYQDRLNDPELADRLGVSRQTVWKWRQKWGLYRSGARSVDG